MREAACLSSLQSLPSQPVPGLSATNPDPGVTQAPTDRTDSRDRRHGEALASHCLSFSRASQQHQHVAAARLQPLHFACRHRSHLGARADASHDGRPTQS
ncbi:hypothetical protein CCMA1212_001878 [Trichoderma ghanense]|uniref:Uncharacterized protein n=1 Tax=Trichoderma ghanense TaxID=65468 RepID=A0ABY2HGU8_9HYPO